MLGRNFPSNQLLGRIESLMDLNKVEGVYSQTGMNATSSCSQTIYNRYIVHSPFRRTIVVTMDELIKKIESSQSFKSFIRERDVSKLFHKYGWDTQHGAYYQDVDEKKYREIDVIARQIWEKQTKFGKQLIRLTVPVEVKTMNGYHIIVSSLEREKKIYCQNIVWLGDSSSEYLKVRTKLLDSGLPDNTVHTLIQRLHDFAYPRQQARTFSLMLRPQDEVVFTSFRETNIGSEKDLDNSVFWRASQSLYSAAKSITESIYEYHLDGINFTPIERNYIGDEKKCIEEIFSRMCFHVQMIDIIHPIVVTDAMLWAVNEPAPQEISWCRFSLHEYNSSVVWWCDLVNSNHLIAYLNKLTKHYTLALKKSKAKRSQ
jgi:hypothetical protein